MPTYDAFISYSHAKDKPIAAALQSVIQRLGKAWYRRRVLRVFRDDTSLSASPQLWPSIEKALSESRFLVLLASPEAAASPWVAKEVLWWLDNRGADTLLIGLTNGELTWDHSIGDFHWCPTTPLPRVLVGRLSEPKWVNLRAFRDDANTKSLEFMSLAADFAATIRSMPKEDLLSQEVRQQRRALILAWSTVVAFALLIGLVSWLAFDATTQRKEAQNQTRIALENENRAKEALGRAERNRSIATDAVGNLVFRLAVHFKNREGVPIDFIRGVLALADDTLTSLVTAGEESPTSVFYTATSIHVVALTQAEIGDYANAKKLLSTAIDYLQALTTTYDEVPEFNLLLSSSYVDMGRISSEVNDLQDAVDYLTKAIAAAERVRHKVKSEKSALHQLSVANVYLGDVMLMLGSTEESLQHHRMAYDFAVRMNEIESSDLTADEALALSSERLGVALMRNHDLPGAMEMYVNLAATAEKRLQVDPQNTHAQLALSVSKNKMGDIYFELHELAKARVSYEESLAAIERLARADPKRADWQYDLSYSHRKMGDILRELGDTSAALARYKSALEVLVALAEAHPEEYKVQWDVSLMHSRVGEAYLSLENPKEALVSFEAAAQVGEKLQHQVTRPDMMRDLSVYYEQLGHTHALLNNLQKALQFYERGLEIRKSLLEQDPMRRQWHIDIVVVYDKIASLLNRMGNVDLSIENMRRAIDAQSRLVHSFLNDAGELNVLATLHNHLGDVLIKRGRRQEAVRQYELALSSRQELVNAEPNTEQWHINLAISHFRLARNGVSAIDHLGQALKVLTDLDREGRLSDKNRKLIELIGDFFNCAVSRPKDISECGLSG
jgi:tetratricopeptide (TPR) repeat protein